MVDRVRNAGDGTGTSRERDGEWTGGMWFGHTRRDGWSSKSFDCSIGAGLREAIAWENRREREREQPAWTTFCQTCPTNPQDPQGPVTLRTSKFITNRLLNRKQFVLTVLHPTRANLSRNELSEKLAALYKTDKERVVVFGLKTKFGGGSSQGFGMVYDDEESQKKFEPKHRLVRVCVVFPFVRGHGTDP